MSVTLTVTSHTMRKAFFVLAVFCFGFALTTVSANAATTVASGTITANGSNVSAGWVEIYGNNRYAGSEIGSNGQYSISDPVNTAWSAGAYTIRVIPDTKTYPQLSSSTTNVTLSGSGTLNQNITLGTASKQIQVTVRDQNNAAAAITVRVKASGGGGGMSFMQETNAQGVANFTVRPEGAPYYVSFDNCQEGNDGSRECSPWVYTGDSITVSFDTADSEAETKAITVTGEATTATVIGNITYEGEGFEGFINLYNDEHLFTGWMESTGDFTVYALPGAYKVDLLPKQSQENFDVVRYYIDDETIGGAINAVEGTTDVGNLAASYESSTIMATVQDEDGNGLEGVVANFWLAGGGEWRQVTLMPGAAGSVGSEAHAGTYYVNAVDPTGEYLSAPAQAVEVEENSEPTVALTMVRTNATVNFTVENEDGSRAATYNSFINCWDNTNNRGNGGVITRGSATITLVAGTYTCTSMTPQNAEASLAPTEITLAENESEEATLTVAAHDAAVSGTIVDQNGDPIIPAENSNEALTVVLEGEQYGRFEVPVESDGTWSKDLPADTYTLAVSGEEIIPILGETAQTVTVASGEVTADQTMQQFAADSTVSATVMAPDGSTPLPFAPVTCTYTPAGEKGDFEGGRVIEVTGETDESGAVTIPVLSQDGDVALTYDCGVSVSQEAGYIAPATTAVLPGDEANFQVFEPDSTLTVAYDAATTLDVVQCQAWADGGLGMVTATDDDGDGEVVLDVSSEAAANWKVSCSGTEGSTWFTPEESKTVAVSAPGDVDTTIAVVENAVVVPDGASESFDGTGEKSLALEGVALNVPANSIESDGDVTLTVTPTATDVPKNENSINIGIPVNVQAFDDSGNIKTAFTQPIVMTMPYDEQAVQDAGIVEADLVPKYFDESGGTWQTIAGYTVDADANTITFSTTHFTQFGIMFSAAETETESAPAKVTNVKVPKKSIKKRSAKVTWAATDSATTYTVQLFTKKGKKLHTFTGVEKRTVTIKKKWLKAGKKYTVRVRAVSAGGVKGDWSTYVRFTTDAQ